jgi:hypothetical protein
MPGPKSTPKARTANGRLVQGKSALRREGLRSGEGIGVEDVPEKSGDKK